MISVVVTGDKELLERLQNFVPKLNASISRTMLRLAIMVQNRAKQKLSGDVLKVRTNTLRSSINQKVTESGNVITATIGSGVKYAGYHEYGFTGVVSVAAFMRRSRGQMKTARFDKMGRETSSSKLQGKGSGSVMVSAHSRKINYPAHSFLRSSLRELTPTIRAELRAAASEATK